MAAGTAYFLRRTVQLLETHRETAVFDSGDVAAVIVSLGVLLLSFSNVTFSHISVGRVLIVLTVLVCARIGGLAGGAGQPRHGQDVQRRGLGKTGKLQRLGR